MLDAHKGLTPSVYASRLGRLRRKMAHSQLDAMLLRDPANILYLAGVAGLGQGRPIWLLVPQAGDCALVVPRIEAPVARRASWVSDQREWVEWPDGRFPGSWAEPLAELVRERRCWAGRLGIELDCVTARTMEQLREILPGSQFVDGARALDDVRRRKEPIELELLRIAGRVAVAELEGARAALAVGVPEFELGLAARAAGTRAAAEYLGSDFHLVSPVIAGVQSIVAAGPLRSAMPHARASTYRIGASDIVQLCLCGPTYFTYNVGFDRPLFIEESRLGTDQVRLLDVALAAHDAALRAIRPGVPASFVHAAATHQMEVDGVLEYRAHRTGRGVGAAGAEAPELRESDDTELEPGVTFTVEPGIYIPGVGGARFGDTVAVTATGYELLTAAGYGWGGR